MAPSKIRKALGAVKDQTSIGLAKVSNSNSISDLDVAIVKATRHDEQPAEERHIREILSLTCYSRNYITQCVSTLSRRLSKTRSWTVALKTLILIHRLLSEGDAAYEQEIFFTTRRGTRMLNLSDFRDASSRSVDAWDYSAFVRTYARYLDEMLENRVHGRKGRRRSRSQQMHEDVMVMDEEEKCFVIAGAKVQATPLREMGTHKIFARAQHLQQLLERFLACRPTGSAKNNRIVEVALYAVLKESYQLYFDLQEVMAIFLDRFMDLDTPDCDRVYDIFTRLSKQFDDLDRFYSWCKSAGISHPSEYPEIDKLTRQKLEVMEDFLREKSSLPRSNKIKSFEQLTNEEDAMRVATEETTPESSSSSPLQIKALPAPEEEHKQEEQEQVRKEEHVAIVKVEEEVDFLNLRDDERMTVDDHADRFALALFDIANTAPALPPAWEAFTDDTADWETALVESASNLSGQRAALGGGFDMLLLDGMYNQPQPETTFGSGSASRPKAAPMLALPAPPTTGGGFGGDPFAASLAVPAPAYVQMPEMEKKWRMLVEEREMWQQYAKDGMQGKASIAMLQQSQEWMYPMGGGYIQRF